MKKVIIGIGSISIGFGIYMLTKGNPFVDQLALFVNGVVLVGMAFIDDKKTNCQTDK
jgi:hypothetical protein